MKFDIYEQYEPENPLVSGAIYVKNSVGDWYDIQKEFGVGTLKIQVDENGNIQAYTTDASALNPVNSAVIELNLENVPADLQNDGTWMVNEDNQIVKRVLTKAELIAAADVEKSQRLAIAKEVIEPLSDAVDFDDATDEEVERLKLWKKYRLALTRIDTALAPDIEWPTQPE